MFLATPFRYALRSRSIRTQRGFPSSSSTPSTSSLNLKRYFPSPSFSFPSNLSRCASYSTFISTTPRRASQSNSSHILAPPSYFNSYLGAAFLSGSLLAATQDDSSKEKEKEEIQTESESSEVYLAQALSWNVLDILKVATLSLFTFGLGYILAPAIDYWFLQKEIRKMRIGKKRFQFTATLEDWIWLYLKNFGFGFLTFGLYQIFGFAERNRYRLIDSHLKLLE